MLPKNQHNNTVPTSRVGRAAVLAGLLLGLSLAGCRDATANEAKPEPARAAAGAAEKRTLVRFAAVTAEVLPRDLELSGSLRADESSDVAAPIGGVVTDVRVDVGSRVRKGDVLAVLDARDAQLHFAQAAAAVAQSRARLGLDAGPGPGQKFDPLRVPEVVAAREGMDLAVAEADRARALFASGAISDAAWDQARTAAERATAQHDAALAGARQGYAALGAAQAQAGLAAKALSDTTIRAPFDGAVAERRVSRGELAPPGRVIAVVVRDNPLRLQIEVPEVDIPLMEIGREIELSVAAAPDRVFKGTIRRLGASLREKARTLPIEAEVPNDSGALRPGFFARARIPLAGSEERVLLVPAAAVGTSGSAARVFVRDGERVVERIVKVGRTRGDLVEITGAVVEADQVAVSEVASLADGALITPAR